MKNKESLLHIRSHTCDLTLCVAMWDTGDDLHHSYGQRISLVSFSIFSMVNQRENLEAGERRVLIISKTLLGEGKTENLHYSWPPQCHPAHLFLSLLSKCLLKPLISEGSLLQVGLQRLLRLCGSQNDLLCFAMIKIFCSCI